MSEERDPLDGRRADIGGARFNVRHWRERLAIAMVRAAADGMSISEIEKRAGGELALPKAESIVRHLADCTQKKHQHLRWDKHGGSDLAAYLDSENSGGENPESSIRVRITDHRALRRVTPQGVQAYLGRRGWRLRPGEPGRAIVWALPGPEGGEYEVLGPSDQGYKDYPQRVSELLRTLSIVEDRSELDILEDLRTAGETEPAESADSQRPA